MNSGHRWPYPRKLIANLKSDKHLIIGRELDKNKESNRAVMQILIKMKTGCVYKITITTL